MKSTHWDNFTNILITDNTDDFPRYNRVHSLAIILFSGHYTITTRHRNTSAGVPGIVSA